MNELVGLSNLCDKKSAEAKISPIHLPDIVNLLRGIGYHISRVDGCHPDDTTLLKENKKGVRIVITCNYSGQRYYLEKPASDCNCAEITSSKDESKGTFWEITGVQPSSSKDVSLVESGGDLVPPLTDSMKTMIFKVINGLNFLIHQYQVVENIIRDNRKSLVTKMTEKSKKSTSLSEIHLTRGTENSTIPEICVTSPRSPARHRSLDNLLGSDSQSHTSVATLKQPISKSESSIYISSEDLESVFDKSKSSIAESDQESVLDFLKIASSNIQSAMSIMESTMIKKYKDNIQKVKALRSTSPLSLRSVSSPTLSKTSASGIKKSTTIKSKISIQAQKFVRKPSTSSVKDTKFEKKSESKKSQCKNVTKSQDKVAEDQSAQTKPVKRTSSLYTHIKSTIPKPSLKKK